MKKLGMRDRENERLVDSHTGSSWHAEQSLRPTAQPMMTEPSWPCDQQVGIAPARKHRLTITADLREYCIAVPDDRAEQRMGQANLGGQIPLNFKAAGRCKALAPPDLAHPVPKAFAPSMA